MQVVSRSTAFRPRRPTNVTVMMAIGVISSSPATNVAFVSSQGRSTRARADSPVKNFQSIGNGRECLRRGADRGAVLDQAVKVHADVGGLGGGIGERNGAIEGDARLLVAAELHQQRTLDAEKMEVP